MNRLQRDKTNVPQVVMTCSVCSWDLRFAVCHIINKQLLGGATAYLPLLYIFVFVGGVFVASRDFEMWWFPPLGNFPVLLTSLHPPHLSLLSRRRWRFRGFSVICRSKAKSPSLLVTTIWRVNRDCGRVHTYTTPWMLDGFLEACLSSCHRVYCVCVNNFCALRTSQQCPAHNHNKLATPIVANQRQWNWGSENGNLQKIRKAVEIF